MRERRARSPHEGASERTKHGASTRRVSEPVPSSGGAISSVRPSARERVPAAWIDRLLAAAIDLPIAEGERAVIEALVDAVAAILPSYAVGACMVPSNGVGEATIVKRSPAVGGEVAGAGGIDPTRLFAAAAQEHVVPVPGTGGSTLHVATGDAETELLDSPAASLLERAAMALGHALGSARIRRVRERDAGSSADVRLIQTEKLATFGQIAAGMVHELNNPLTSIVAYSDYLLRKAVQSGTRDADDVERLRRIGESADRVLRFTRDLVSYARPSTRAVGPVVLHGVMDRALAFCEHVLAGAKMRVERRYGAGPITVRGVSEELVQVFVNLFTNASQAAPEDGGRVVVSTSSIGVHTPDGTERHVEIVIEDDGRGITPEHLPQVFVPFFTTKGDRQGTGLGLSIVKSIVESHDGSIRAESHAGRGARFVIELPLGRV